MRKLKLFLENFLIYGFGGIISKVIPLIMVPIVTRLMPDTSYYGISDMAGTVVSFANAIAVMGMYDAMYRMFFEKEDTEYRKEICSTALSITLVTALVVTVVMILSKDYIAKRFLGGEFYVGLVYIMAITTLSGSTNNIIAAPTRMQNKRKIFLIMNVAVSLLSYSISILLLLSGNYIIALPLAGAVTAIVTEISFIILNRGWFRISKIKKAYLKPLLMIAVPLCPNFLIYWVFNSCDKLMITSFLGLSSTGIYSVGAKLGHASQLIYTAFAGGWQFFAFSTMKEQNQVKSNSKIFEYLGIVSFSVTGYICAWSSFIYKLLFTGDYVDGYIVAPYLFLAPLLQMLFQVACNQFIVIKKTWPNMFILSAGAVINVILNVWLIPLVGIEGAAIATLAGYAVSNIVCVFVLSQMRLMEISGRFILSSIIMLFYFVIWRFIFMDSIYWCTAIATGIMLIYILLYWKDISNLYHMVKKHI